MSAPRWLKPWMVAAALVVVAGVGSTVVYFAAERQHRQDRAAITAWESKTAVSLSLAETAVSDVGALLQNGAPVARIRSAIPPMESAIRVLDQTQAPPILEFVARGYRSALRDGIDAALAGKRQAWADAVRRFIAARAALIKLQCRAVMPNCEELHR